MKTEQHFGILLLLIFTITISATTLAIASDMRVRKNIDTLSATELENYLHALDILIKRPPDRKDSYSYFAAVHNRVNVGPCEHARDTFFPWHRAHLIQFENALRATDPPKTSEVTVPYWNWSSLPTGNRYPKAYENELILQADENRNDVSICRPGQTTDCQNLPWPWEYLRDEVLSVSTWSSGANPSQSFGGASDGNFQCKQRNDGGYGALESPSHNLMHDGYINGLMASPSTAARDPIFFSFHAFIDLLWFEWQEQPGSTVSTCLDCELCGLGTKVRDVINSEQQLKVVYEFTQPVAVAGAAERTTARPHVPIDMAFSATETPLATEKMDISIPSAAQDEMIVEIVGVNIQSPRSYQINAFFYPKSDNLTFEPQNMEFREKYMVYLGAVWMAHHGGHGGSEVRQNFKIDLTQRINELLQTEAGNIWELRVDTLLSPTVISGPQGIEVVSADHMKEILKIEGLKLKDE